MTTARLTLLALLMAVPIADAHAAAPAREYKPTGAWTMDYADKSCRLIRDLSDGEDQLTLILERTGLEPQFSIGLASSKLILASNAREIAFSYRSGGESRTSSFLESRLSDQRPAVILLSADILEDITVDQPNGVRQFRKPLGQLLRDEIDAAKSITSIEVREGYRSGFSIAIGPMDQAVAAMQACAADLVASWGLDVPRLLATANRPQPKESPGKWISSSDYSPDMLARAMGSYVEARLMLAENGKVESCVAVVALGDEFQQAVCRGLTRRAKFDPTFDADGKPLRTYASYGFRFAFN